MYGVLSLRQVSMHLLHFFLIFRHPLYSVEVKFGSEIFIRYILNYLIKSIYSHIKVLLRRYLGQESI